MSRANFDPRDRMSVSPTPWRIRLMARSGGYVMVRGPGMAEPFVLTEKRWAKLPLFVDESAP